MVTIILSANGSKNPPSTDWSYVIEISATIGDQTNDHRTNGPQGGGGGGTTVCTIGAKKIYCYIISLVGDGLRENLTFPAQTAKINVLRGGSSFSARRAAPWESG